MSEVDLGALQQQLQQHRSNLAADILARLPASNKKLDSKESKIEPVRRSATLGVGADSSRSLSAVDQKLRAQLSRGKKRVHESSKEIQEEPEEDGKAAVVGKKSAHRHQDPFAKAEAKYRTSASVLPPEVASMSKAQRKKWNKKQRLASGEASASALNSDRVESEAPAQATTPTGDKSPRAQMREKPEKTTVHEPTDTRGTANLSSASGSSASLTSLQSSMLNSLKGARFRSINEQLYTNASVEARRMMLEDPKIFHEYHDGFRQQVRKWPTNPVDRIADLLLDTKRKNTAEKVRAAHLSGALVVDIGAGEASLAQKLASSDKHALSYDLLDTPDGWVRGLDAAQIQALPLPGLAYPLGICWDPLPKVQPAMADVAVFCLSLMGTNWVEMVAESWRIMKQGGELIIAEVASRFGAQGTTDAFAELVSALGFCLDWTDASNTHFVLFKFTKIVDQRTPSETSSAETLKSEASPSNLWSSVLNASQAATAQQILITKGASILKPCLYKRR
ncbi:25S rRNA (adenine(645)-N(1))-methyltransferase [Malassezia yamatoensis]|uniref:Ribosomal RNA-processing protein 8 n=1 Tax=Malassezia yamatoensis TaxID=253288 RepID=A0AAJ5YQT7_9BASI|nr:25S rRNA (adenine(645)-N(1))-methyltransferase [Malassezia yamatoensis]